MKRHFTRKPRLAFAIAVGSFCLAAAAQGDDLKVDCCAIDGTAAGSPSVAGGASEGDCCAGLDSRVKDLEAAASSKRDSKVSLTASGVVTMEVRGAARR